MNTLGILLVFLSACCHAGWNLLSKSSESPMTFLYKALKYSAIVYLPLFVAAQFFISHPWPYLGCILASGLMTGGYFLFLGLAYREGHLSVAYPLARSLPILVVTFGGMLFGEIPGPVGAGGMILIVTGCLMLPLRRLKWGEGGFSPGAYFNRACLWAVISALFTAGYSLIDRLGARLAPSSSGLESFLSRASYVYMQNLLSFIFLYAILRWNKMPFGGVDRGRAFISGIVFLISYLLIMLALRDNPVAYVVSFRQLSVVIGALASMLWLEKEFLPVRMLAVLLVFAGAVMVGIG